MEAQNHVADPYDEALAKNQGLLFIVTSWNEMQPAAVNSPLAGVAVQLSSY